MVNYALGKIYKLVNNVDDEIYVGSTCNHLRIRKQQHKSKAKTEPRKVHHHLNSVGWDNVKIILIETYECKNKDELHKRERYWIDELKSSLNKSIPTRTQAEWREDNKDILAAKSKIYCENNKDYLNNMNRVWMNEHYTNKPENKLRKIAYDKAFHLKPENILKKAAYCSVQITCDCGKTLSKVKHYRHLKGPHHARDLAQKNNVIVV